MARPTGKLLSGQFLGWHPHVTMGAAEDIFAQAGKWVAIIGLDYYETMLDDDALTEPQTHKPARWREVNPLAKEYWSKGGLTTISLDLYGPTPLDAADRYNEMSSTGKPFALAEFGPPGGSLDSETLRNYDYAPFAEDLIDAGSGIVYFLAWRDSWGLHRNPGTRELLSDPLVLNRDDLARELFPKLVSADSV
jgi:Glycosyl hydrolase family 26